MPKCLKIPLCGKVSTIVWGIVSLSAVLVCLLCLLFLKPSDDILNQLLVSLF